MFFFLKTIPWLLRLDSWKFCGDDGLLELPETGEIGPLDPAGDTCPPEPGETWPESGEFGQAPEEIVVEVVSWIEHSSALTSELLCAL